MEWARPSDQSDGLLTRVLPRDNELSRPDRRGRAETLAANIDQVIVVVASLPVPDPFLVDRYLATAEMMGAVPCIAYNKADLDTAGPALDLDEFRRLGYAVHVVSAVDGQGLRALAADLAVHTSILVGQSGVGKSSLLNALLPGVDAETAEVSTATGMGKHTTTASVLHHLPGAGVIIDSPGVRDFAPPPVPSRDVISGYRDIRAEAVGCRFANCMHLREPDCAVKNAVDQGKVSPRRYESYRRLVRLMDELGQRD